MLYNSQPRLSARSQQFLFSALSGELHVTHAARGHTGRVGMNSNAIAEKAASTFPDRGRGDPGVAVLAPIRHRATAWRTTQYLLTPMGSWHGAAVGKHALCHPSELLPHAAYHSQFINSLLRAPPSPIPDARHRARHVLPHRCTHELRRCARRVGHLRCAPAPRPLPARTAR